MAIYSLWIFHRSCIGSETSWRYWGSWQDELHNNYGSKKCSKQFSCKILCYTGFFWKAGWYTYDYQHRKWYNKSFCVFESKMSHIIWFLFSIGELLQWNHISVASPLESCSLIFFSQLEVSLFIEPILESSRSISVFPNTLSHKTRFFFQLNFYHCSASNSNTLFLDRCIGNMNI